MKLRILLTAALFNLALLDSSCLVGQQRIAIAGRVLNRDGTSVAGAELTLVHRTVPWTDLVGSADVLTAETDDAGRFRVELLPRCGYSAWARWTDASDHPHVTSVLEHVLAGEFVTLRESEPEHVHIDLRVSGTKRWQKFGPLRYRLIPRSINLHMVPVQLTEGRATRLPILPDRAVCLEVVTEENQVLWSRAISIVQRRDSSSPVHAESIEMPQPFIVKVKVSSSANGKGLAGAEIRRMNRGFQRTYSRVWPADNIWHEMWRLAGHTNAEGEAEIALPLDRKRLAAGASFTLAVRAEGHAEVFGGWRDGHPYAAEEYLAGDPKEMTFSLAPADPVTGRLLWAGSRPVANAPVLLQTWGRTPKSKNNGYGRYSSPLYLVETSADGTFTLPLAPASKDYFRVLTVLESKASAGPQVWLPFQHVDTRTTRALGTATVAEGSTHGFQVVDAISNPVRALPIWVKPKSEPIYSDRDFSLPAYTDGAGRFRIPLVPGEYLAMAVDKDRGYLVQPFAVSDDVTENPKFELQPFQWVSGLVADEDGTPIRGASVSEMARRGGRPDGVEWTQSASVDSLNGGSLLHGETDGDGRFRLPYIPCEGISYRLDIGRTSPGGKRQTSEHWFDSAPGTNNQGLELIFRPRK